MAVFRRQKLKACSFLVTKYNDLEKFPTTVRQKLSKLGEELSGLSVKIEEIYKAMEALQ